MKVLVVNAGSSSLKYQLFDTESAAVLAKGNCERIGIDGSRIIHKTAGKEQYIKEGALRDHSEAMKLVVETLILYTKGFYLAQIVPCILVSSALEFSLTEPK